MFITTKGAADPFTYLTAAEGKQIDKLTIN